MRKSRIPPPLGLSSKPNLVKSAEREAEILAEFKRRLGYVLASFRFGLAPNPFNLSLAHLKRTVKRGPTLEGRGQRLHPYLEMLINIHAMKFAADRSDQQDARITQLDVERAAAHIAATLAAERGRPRAAVLEHHVGGLMALIQETSGRAVISSRQKGVGEYDPRLAPGVSQILLHLRTVDPLITETQLANKVHELRKRYAGRAMSFRDFFPLYGATIGPDGDPVCAPPVKLEYFKHCHPIYCR